MLPAVQPIVNILYDIQALKLAINGLLEDNSIWFYSKIESIGSNPNLEEKSRAFHAFSIMSSGL